MFAHVSHAMELYSPGRVIIWSIDMDVAAICPRAMLLLDIKEVSFKTGVRKQETFHSYARSKFRNWAPHFMRTASCTCTDRV